MRLTAWLAGALAAALGGAACATPIEIPLADGGAAWSADARRQQEPPASRRDGGGGGPADSLAWGDQPPPGAPDAGSPSLDDGDGDCCVGGAVDAAPSDGLGSDAAAADGGADGAAVADGFAADAAPDDAETTNDDAAGDLP